MNIFKIAALLSGVLTGLVLIYALWLLTAGIEITTMMENASAITVSRTPAPAAWLPLLASLAILWGLWKKQAFVSWMGAALLLVFSLLFLFSIGGALLLPAIGLIILLLVARSFSA